MTIQSEFNETMHMLMNVYRELPLAPEEELVAYCHGKGLYSVFDRPNNMLVFVFADSSEAAKRRAAAGVSFPIDLEELGIETEVNENEDI